MTENVFHSGNTNRRKGIHVLLGGYFLRPAQIFRTMPLSFYALPFRRFGRPIPSPGLAPEYSVSRRTRRRGARDWR